MQYHVVNTDLEASMTATDATAKYAAAQIFLNSLTFGILLVMCPDMESVRNVCLLSQKIGWIQ